MNRYLVGAVAIAVSVLPISTAFAEQTPAPAELIAKWQEQNGLCRGFHGDDPRTQPACDERQRLGRALDAQGWCYGKKEQMGYQMEWHKCGPDSLHSE